MKYPVFLYSFMMLQTVFWVQAQTDSTKPLIQEEVKLKLGNTPVSILTYQRGDSEGVVYFNMHDNENTAVEASHQMIDKHGGKFIEIHHSGERLIVFYIRGVKYLVDPNRIFTKKGIQMTLRKYGNYSAEAQAEVERFAQEVIEIVLGKHQFVIAMHNNFNLRTFSINSFKPSGAYSKEAKEVYANEERGTGDFFYVLDKAHFDYFKSYKMNVVLQDNSNFTDDGSLSAYCAQKEIPYINVEAQHGHLSEQLEMLETLQGLLASFLETQEK